MYSDPVRVLQPGLCDYMHDGWFQREVMLIYSITVRSKSSSILDTDKIFSSQNAKTFSNCLTRASTIRRDSADHLNGAEGLFHQHRIKQLSTVISAASI